MVDEYKEVLQLLQERLDLKHKQYGQTYLDRDFPWLRRRLNGEIVELDDALFSDYFSGVSAVDEALDVAICALLIADKKRREDLKQWPDK